MPAMNGPPTQNAQLPRDLVDIQRGGQPVGSLGRSSAPPGQQRENVQNAFNNLSETSNPPQIGQSAIVDSRQAPAVDLSRQAMETATQTIPNAAILENPLGPPIDTIRPARAAPAPPRPKREGEESVGAGGRPFSPIQRVKSPVEDPVQGYDMNVHSTPGGSTSQSVARPPPADAFYYGPRSPANATFGPGSPRDALASSSRSKLRESLVWSSREATMKALLQKAMAQGFVPPQDDQTTHFINTLKESDKRSSVVGDSSVMDRLIALKQKHADLEVSRCEIPFDFSQAC